MVKKFAFNFLINIGLIFCVATIYWGFQHHQYLYIAAPVFLIGLLIIFKLRLLKEIKNAEKNSTFNKKSK